MKIAPTGSSLPMPAIAGAEDSERAAHPPERPATEAAAAQPAQAPAREHLEQAVARANRQMAAVAPSLQFEVDPKTRDVIIRLVDRHDQHVLRQVPAPEMLAIARALDRMQALLLRARA